MSTALGSVKPGFEAVAEEFARNFAERDELGAAFAVVVDGELVVDLWGGVADQATGTPWQEDTLEVLFSGTKVLLGVCLLLLIERGELDLDAPVSRYWPAFGRSGKESILVRDIASHTDRLPVVRPPLEEHDLTDPERIAALLAEQPPESDPRAEFMYHALTCSWLGGELIRRIDGRTLGRFFADEVAAPLGLDLWIGLPAEHEQRVATIRYAPSWGANPIRAIETRRDDDELMELIAHQRRLLFPPGRLPWNLRAFHAAEIAGAGGIGTARSMARLCGCLARGGELDGVQLLRPETVELGRTPLASGQDTFMGQPMAYGVSFQLQTERRRLGTVADAYGWDSAGGGMHCAWPSHRTGVCYLMNELRDDIDGDHGDPRAQALLRVLHATLESPQQR